MADEDQDAVATTYCNNCKRDIPSVNYIMHQTHCVRNIVLCSQCQEPVPRSEMDEHNEENHTKVTCKCGEAVEKSKQEEHDAEHCPQRQVQCEYCEMDMDFKNMTEHKDFCGSRTDPCPLCKRYIFFRDKAQHEDSNCQYPEVKPAKSNPMGSSLPNKQWQRDPFMFGLPEASRTNQFPSGLFGQFPVAPLGRTRDMVEGRRDVVPREMRSTSSEGMTDDRKHRKNQDRVQNMMAKSVTRPREKNEERALLQTVVNQEESDERLAQHLAQDLPFDSSFSRDYFPAEDFQSSRDYADDVDINEIMKEAYSIPSVNTFRDQTSVLGDLSLPCEFCQQPIPVETLTEHQSGCRPDLTCHPVTDASTANNSRRRGHQGQPQPPSDVLNNLGYGTIPQGYISSSVGQPDSSQGYDEDDLTMLPCEFCDVLLPQDALPMHQVNCLENRTMTPLPATFDTAPGSYPRGEEVERPARQMVQRVQRPQDFAVPSRPKKYQEEQPLIDASIDDDDNGDIDTVPVRMPKSRNPFQVQSRNPRKQAPLAPTFLQGSGSLHPLGRSPSEKYLHGSNKGSHNRPTATVASLPSGGAVPKPKFTNTERPQGKSSARIQETLQGLYDASDEEEELNNMVGTRLNSRQGIEQDSYTPGNNRYKAKGNFIPPSSLELDGQTPASYQSNPPHGFNNPQRQPFSGARQKTSRKPHSNSKGLAQGDGYSPSFAKGENQRRSKDRERMGNNSVPRKAKQQSAATAVTLAPTV